MAPNESEPTRVRVVDIQMSFSSMVIFLVKTTLAAIPALIILTALAAMVFMVFTALRTAMSVSVPMREPTVTQEDAYPTSPPGPAQRLNEEASTARRMAFQRCNNRSSMPQLQDCAEKLGDCVRAHEASNGKQTTTRELIACLNAVGR